jgi:mannose-6-phosphate isomerase-like protein (cupin superfamily)
MIGKEDLPHIIAREELPHGKISHKFEGYRYEEIFITLEGEATFTVGDDTIEASAGQIVVAPAGVPHKFVNSGTGMLRQVDIHPSGRIQQTDIPEDE